VGAVFPKLIVGNLILFLTVALIVLFVILLLWGFVSTKADKGKGFELESWMKYILLGTISVAAIFAVLWAAGVDSTVIDLLFNQGWSNTFWTNFFFVIVIAGVLALFLKMKDNE
jgi:cytochrome bd-type quinol oxidase subunit 2